MGWSLSGQLFENCSCNVFCPCWFAVPDYMVMDQGWCGGLIALNIEEGDADGTDLSGRTAVIAVHFPGPTMFDGNATARIIIDDGASDEQVAVLEPIMHGSNGGPMEILVPLITNWLPTQTAAIDVSDDGENAAVAVGDTGKVSSHVLRDAEGNGFSLRGGGFVGGFGLEQADIAPSDDGRWDDAEMPVQFETKSGARGAFTWAG